MQGQLIALRDQADNLTTYRWNTRGQMTGMTLPTGSQAEYVYDENGHRTQQTVNGVETNYLWDEFSQYGDVVLESDVNGETTRHYTPVNGMVLSQHTPGTDETVTQYLLGDAQNSTIALADAAGDVTGQYEYDAFGELLDTSATPDTNYLYTGQQYDPMSELYSLRARYYNPVQGRFLSRDEWAYNYQNPLELNRYVYTANNPVNYADPSGNALKAYETAYKPSGHIAASSKPILLAKPYYGNAYLAATLLFIIPVIILLERLIEILLSPLLPKPGENPGTDPNPEPPPKPQPEPDPDDPPDDEDNNKNFFFREVDFQWRKTSEIVSDLTPYTHISGVPGMIAQLENAEAKYQQDTSDSFSYFKVAGRKMESERAIHYASNNNLQDANSTRPGYDFIVSGMGTIGFVEVKWTQSDTLHFATKEIIRTTRDILPDRTYLVEINNISSASKSELRSMGGTEIN